MRIAVEMGWHSTSSTEVTVEIGRIKHIPKPTEREIDACPDNFVCFVCLKSHPKRKFGGLVSGKWVCRDCRPYVDDYYINLLGKFDDRRTKAHRTIKRLPKPGNIIPDDWLKFEEYYLDSMTLEEIEVPEDKVIEIEELTRRYDLWKLASKQGFPGFHAPKSDKLGH